jgi:hypothetical protein
VIFIGHLSTTDLDRQFERKFVPRRSQRQRTKKG